jgi:ABC-type branched-subunit amino acid transport system ATPase component
MLKAFGGNRAVAGISFDVGQGEAVALIGPNGAGKTTLLNLLSGQYRPDGGRVLFCRRDVTRLAASHALRRGMLRAYQDGGVFAKLTAVENVMVPALARGLPLRQAEQSARAALTRLGLAPVSEERAERLSGGQRKLVDFARCLVTDAKIIMLDEPTTGVHPSVARSLALLIEERQAKGAAFLVVSHDLPWAFGLCSRAIVMVAGEKLIEDRPEIVGSDPRVHEAYL